MLACHQRACLKRLGHHTTFEGLRVAPTLPLTGRFRVLAGMIDIVMSEAIRSTLEPATFRGMSTITITVNYLDVAQGDLTAAGRADCVGKTTGFASAEVRNKAGKLVATGQGTFRIIR